MRNINLKNSVLIQRGKFIFSLKNCALIISHKSIKNWLKISLNTYYTEKHLKKCFLYYII